MKPTEDIFKEDLNFTETELTLKVIKCGSFQELLELMQKYQAVTSHSRTTPITWDYDKIVRGIRRIRQGYPINNMTRTCGLRAKVAELTMGNNYEDPIPDELQ